MLPKEEECRQSRRTFIKCTLAGAAGTVMMSIDKQAAGAHVAARQEVSHVTQLDLNEASQLLRSKKISPVQLTQECLSRIERLNGKLNAFITVTADSALAEARVAESEIQRGHWRGPLHGIPIGL